MKVVILQPSYIPWRGYFEQIYRADLFIFYDDVEYDKRGWRNRNQIKTASKKQWLTIPVNSKNSQKEHTPINKIPIVWESRWNETHLKTLRQSYQKAPFFHHYEKMLTEFYQRHDHYLADFTIDFTIALAREIGITKTDFKRSSELKGITGKKTDRLLSVLQAVNAKHYISGPSARDYIEEEKFEKADISLEYVNYNYPEYPQLYPPFDPYVSILDLLVMTGPEALNYIIQENHE